MNTNFHSAQMQSASDNYLDTNSLNKITQLSRKDNDAALKEVAKQFEALFLQQMLKTMRDTNQIFAEDNPMNSSEMQFHQEMLDQQMVLNLASGKGMGLAELFYRQMSPEYGKKSHIGGDLSLSERKIFDRKPDATPAALLGEGKVLANDNEVSKSLPFYANETIKAPTKTAEEFVAGLMPYAQEAAKELNLDPDVLIAQAALETGWGKFVIKDRDGNSSFNLFNIKAGESWPGKKVSVSTLEYENGVAQKQQASFRSYDSYAESFADYIKLISNNPRYEKAKSLAQDAASYLDALQEGGYATDPNYADKIKSLLKSEPITQAKNFREWVAPFVSLIQSAAGLE